MSKTATASVYNMKARSGNGTTVPKGYGLNAGRTVMVDANTQVNVDVYNDIVRQLNAYVIPRWNPLIRVDLGSEVRMLGNIITEGEYNILVQKIARRLNYVQ